MFIVFLLKNGQSPLFFGSKSIFKQRIIIYNIPEITRRGFQTMNDQQVRNEYPRPQFMRDDWICLNGIWSYEFDFSDSGRSRGMTNSQGFGKKILVPFCPESKCSGVEFRDFIPAMFYHRKITLPRRWEGKRILLHFGAVDYECEGFINGRSIGTHTGGFSSFSFDITNAAELETPFDFVLHVRDDVRGGKQAIGKQSPFYESQGCRYTRTTGIWQSVWMEAVSFGGLKSCRIVPNTADGTFCFFPLFYEPVNDMELTIRVSAKGDSTENKTISRNGTAVTVHAPGRRFWSPENPFLYDIEYILRAPDGTVCDYVRSYAGLREISLRNGCILLNGKARYLRFVLDQGYYPDGIMTAPSDEMLKQDILLAMRAGFNGARLHQKIFEERFHYWADRLGYITWCESPSWINKDPESDNSYWQCAHQLMAEWFECVKRDCNHPSIIAWTPTNETRTSLSRLRDFRRIISMIYDQTKELDPTRPINDCSGYTHVKTDLWTIHDYTQNGILLKERLAPDGARVAAPAPDMKMLEVPYGGQPYLLDEFGGVGYLPQGCIPHTKSWAYGEKINTQEAYCTKLKELVDAVLSVPSIAGYCYTQLTDVEQEENGIYCFDRSEKVSSARLAAIFGKEPEHFNDGHSNNQKISCCNIKKRSKEYENEIENYSMKQHFCK